MRWSRGWMANTSSSTPASIRDRMSRSKNVATRAGYLLVKTASFTLSSPPLRPNVQQDPCGQAVEVNAMTAMRLRPLAWGRVGCHVAGALQLRGPPATASPAPDRRKSWSPDFGCHSGCGHGAALEHDLRHGFARVRGLVSALARCSEQSRRKAVTQSHGANAVPSATLAGPPAIPTRVDVGGPVCFSISGGVP